MTDPVDVHLAHARRADALRDEALDELRRARLWTAVDRARGQAQVLRWGGLAVAAAAAAVVALWSPMPATVEVARGAVRAVEGGALEPRTMLEVLEPAELRLAGDRLWLEAGTRWLWDDGALAVDAGTMRLWARAAPWSVVTAEARVEVLSAEVVVVRAASRTRVDVRAGEVVVRVAGLEPRRVRAPEIVEVGPGAPRSTPVSAAGGRPSGAAERASDAPASIASVPAAPSPSSSARASVASPPAAGSPAPASPAPASPAPASPAAGSPAPASPAPASPANVLADARALLAHDSARARTLAQSVLDAAPAAELRAGAWMVIADAARLESRWAEAEATYARVEESPGAAPFVEEALLRRGELWLRLQRPQRALEIMRSSRAEAAVVLLRPERAVVVARAELALGRPSAAAQALEALPAEGPAPLQRARLDVARALRAEDGATARRLLEVVARSAPPALAEEARRALDAP